MTTGAVRSRIPILLTLAAAITGLDAGLAGAQALRHDSTLPIEITADSLEVLRDQQVATFTGNVDAVQGDLTLSADELKVFYRGDERSDDAAATTDDGTIRRIEAAGNVFLTSPRETAEGEEGVYDVASQTVTLERSVVLTRDDNVIEGDRLEMDLASGRSRVTADDRVAEGAEPPRRVRAIFVPEGDEEDDAPAAGNPETSDPEAPPSPTPDESS